MKRPGPRGSGRFHLWPCPSAPVRLFPQTPGSPSAGPSTRRPGPRRCRPPRPALRPGTSRLRHVQVRPPPQRVVGRPQNEAPGAPRPHRLARHVQQGERVATVGAPRPRPGRRPAPPPRPDANPDPQARSTKPRTASTIDSTTQLMPTTINNNKTLTRRSGQRGTLIPALAVSPRSTPQNRKVRDRSPARARPPPPRSQNGAKSLIGYSFGVALPSPSQYLGAREKSRWPRISSQKRLHLGHDTSPMTCHGASSTYRRTRWSSSTTKVESFRSTPKPSDCLVMIPANFLGCR